MVLNIYGDAKDIKIMDDEISSIKKKYNSYYKKYNNLNKILLNEDYYDDNEKEKIIKKIKNYQEKINEKKEFVNLQIMAIKVIIDYISSIKKNSNDISYLQNYISNLKKFL
jgi:valyl-tRNA synthetase